jgi:hypothetical protein
VGYRVNSNFQLERLGKVLDWDGSAPGGPFINSGYTSTTNSITNTWTDVGDAPSFTDGTDPDYRVLADGVFRLSFCFLETTIVNGPNGPTTNTAYAYPVNGTPAPGIYPLDYTVASGAAGAETSTHTHVSGIVVALGILDDTSRIRAEPSASTVTALPDTNMPPLIAGNWANLISSSAFPGNAGLPAAVAGEIRVYQRTFTLDESLFQP